jgi:hypothetical protein
LRILEKIWENANGSMRDIGSQRGKKKNTHEKWGYFAKLSHEW